MAMEFGERIFCYVQYTCKAGQRQKCMDAINEMKIQERYQAQPGNILYSYLAPTNDENKLFLVDMWDNQEHFDMHVKSDVVPDFAKIKAEYIEDTKLIFQLGGK